MTNQPPTPFAELNAVLAGLVDGARGILGGNFVGAYLQGSFALGGGNEASDCDFVVVVREDFDDSAAERLSEMHTALHARAETWAQHLEGSYFPAAVLRNLRAAPTEAPDAPRPVGWVDPKVLNNFGGVYPTWFLGNGERTLVRSEHDNTLVVRWILRERGIALAGPPARTLVDAVDPGELRAEVTRTMRSFGTAVLDGSLELDALWLQGFTVLFFLRAMATLETGTILSKPAAIDWAETRFDGMWTGLATDAWQRRAEYPRGVGAPEAHDQLKPSAERVEQTLALVRFALGRVGA